MIYEGQPNAPSTAHGVRSDGATTESLLRRSCADQLRRRVALILRVASLRPASIFPGVDLNLKGRGP